MSIDSFAHLFFAGKMLHIFPCYQGLLLDWHELWKESVLGKSSLFHGNLTVQVPPQDASPPGNKTLLGDY